MLTTPRANAWKYAAIAATLGLGFALLMQTLRLAEAQLETAHTVATLQTERTAAARAALTTSERYRTLEGTHRDQIAKIDTDGRIERGKATMELTLALGRPDLVPRAPVTLRGFKDVVDATDWLVVKLTHTLGDNGLTTRLELEKRVVSS